MFASVHPRVFIFFFFNATAATHIYTLSLHDALPIYPRPDERDLTPAAAGHTSSREYETRAGRLLPTRSEEHTSELQSHHELVCRLLLEKKKTERPLEAPPAQVAPGTDDV